MTTLDSAALPKAPLPIDGAGPLELRMSRSLYDIAGDFLLIEEALPEATDAEAVDLLQQFFNQVSEEAEDKLDRYCELIQEFGARAEIRLREAKRLSELGNNDKRQAERMKGVLLWFLQTRDLRKKETVHFKISRVQNGGLQPMALLVEPERLPDDLRYVTYVAHTDAIRAALVTAGDELRDLELSRQLLHSLSGLEPDKLDMLTGLLRQLGPVEAQIREINADAEARGFSEMSAADLERLTRLTATQEDLAEQAEGIEVFSSWTDEHRQQIHEVEARLSGPPWCFAALQPRGEHVRIR